MCINERDITLCYVLINPQVNKIMIGVFFSQLLRHAWKKENLTVPLTEKYLYHFVLSNLLFLHLVYRSIKYTVNSRFADTLIIWTAAISTAKINYRYLTGEKNSRYYRLLLLRTLTCGSNGVRYKGS